MKNKELKIESTVLTLDQKLNKLHNSIPNVEIVDDVETLTERLTSWKNSTISSTLT